MATIRDRDWLNLSEAARLLGVHPSSVRAWADKGDLPSQRTRGGHRRFRRADLEQWLARHHSGGAPGASLVIQSAMGKVRMELSEGGSSQLPPWYAKMSEATRTTHRDTSRRLLGLLRRYLTSESGDERESLLTEARAMGAEYYRLGRAGNLSLAENVRAFLYFRDFLTESVMQMVETAGNPSLSELHQRTAQFTNEILIALVAAHEKGK